MIQNIVKKYFFYLYVFTLCFGVLLYNTTGFKGMDMISGIILIVFYVIYLIGTKNSNFNIGFLITILIFLFYLNYSFYISDNTRNAIAFDFLTQIRPYVTFFIVSQMSPSFSESQKSLLKKICFYIWLFFIPIGLYATVNPSFLSSMMDQPSNFTACITCLSIVYLYCGDFSVKEKLTSIFMLAIGLIVIHSQFYIFFLLACGLLMYFHHVDVLKNNLRTGLALASIAGLIIYMSRLEILNYLFPVGVTGKGFASLAVQASGFYYQLNELGVQSLNGLISQEWASFSGSYYPVLAQLGVIGIMFYLAFWVYIIAISIIRFRQNGDIQPFIITLILATFIFIENISDSFFTSNKGYFMMMFIGVLLGKPEDTETLLLNSVKTEKKKKKLSPLQIIRSSGKRLFLFNRKAQTFPEITYLTPPDPVRKQEPVIENREVPAVSNPVSNQITPVVKDNQSNELTLKEENKEVISTTVNDSLNQSESLENKQQITVAVQPSALFVGEEDEWEDVFEDEYEWEDEVEEETDEEEIFSEIEEIPQFAVPVEESAPVIEPTPVTILPVIESAPVIEPTPVIKLPVIESTPVIKPVPIIEINDENSIYFTQSPPYKETITNKPAMKHTPNQSNESILNKAGFGVESNDYEEFSEDLLNYMI